MKPGPESKSKSTGTILPTMNGTTKTESRRPDSHKSKLTELPALDKKLKTTDKESLTTTKLNLKVLKVPSTVSRKSLIT